MEIMKNSIAAGLLLRVWLIVKRTCAGSRSAWLYNRIWAWCFQMCSGSWLYGRLTREEPKKHWWKDSLLCRMLTELANLIPTVLGLFYEIGRKMYDGSAFVRTILALGEQVPASISWLLFAMLVAPYEYWNNLYSFGAVILFFLFCFAGDIRRSKPRLRMDAVGFWPVLYALIVVFSFVFSNSVTLSFRYLCFQLTGIGLIILCVGTIEKTGDLLRIVRFGAAGLLVCSAYAMVQRAMGIEVSAVLVDLTVNQDMPGRVYSFFENPNSFAMVLVMLIPMMLALAIYSKSALERILMALILIVSSVALVMTYSRGGYLSLAFALVLFVLILKPKLAPLMILLGLAALPLLPDAVYHRILTIFNSSDTSISSRIPVYLATFELIGDYPITGVGLGSQLLKQMIDTGGYYHAATPYIHAHDIYLQIWAEMGLFGLLAFLGAMASAACKGMRAVVSKKGEPVLWGIAAAGISGLAGILLFGIVDYPWSYPRVMTVFWILFAVTLAAVRLAGKEKG